MIPPIARRFVAGESSDDALDRTRELNAHGVGAILNLLGEHYEAPSDVDEDARAYRALLAAIDETGARACISVKPSQLGLGIDRATFRRQARELVDDAASHDAFVWFDMEDHTTTDATLDTYEAMTDRHPHGVGVCLQANLKRTADDLDRLAGLPGKLRLVKGAYDEPAAVAYRDHHRVNQAMQDLLNRAFRRHDSGIALGSHDPAMIDHAIALQEDHHADFEIQMLMGVREAAQIELAREHDVWQYVPYGSKWLSYFWRRLTERKENFLFALRAVVGG